MTLLISNYFKQYFENLGENLNSIGLAELKLVVNMIRQTKQAGKKIIVVGNGGSAAIASHVAVDFTKAASVRAVNFNEADLLTCFANDYGYAHWVERALASYADAGDLAILISSSGKSPNLVNGARQAKAMGLNLITLSGFSADNTLRMMGDINLWVDSTAYNVVEITHLAWLLAIVDYLIEAKETV